MQRGITKARLVMVFRFLGSRMPPGRRVSARAEARGSEHKCGKYSSSFMALAFAVVGLLPALLAQASERTHQIEPEDYFDIGVADGCYPSPDGKYVAFTESRWDEIPGKRQLDLWVINPDTRELRRLTSDWASDRSPKWSPDGSCIYFASSRKHGDEKDPPYNGKTQVWRIARDGGPLEAVTRVTDGIELFDLSEDGRTLYYTTSKEVVDEEWKDLKSKYKDLEYGHGVTDFSQVWKLDLTLWRAEKLVDEKRVIYDLKVSPDESRIAMLTTPDGTLLAKEGWSRLDVYDTAKKEVSIVTEDGWRKGHPSPFAWMSGVSWSADSKALAFAIGFDGYPSELFVAEWESEQVSYRRLERPRGVTVTDGTQQWRGPARDLCFLGEERARSRVYCIDGVRAGGQGPSTSLTPGDVVVTAFGQAASGDP
ncbi:MAG: hypothetical protein KJ749_12160, partial [Planctomycetes bacterium]|nr:hypothetical protein [Planctomycetota bacterium]